ncbi:MAG: hypothetical protein U1E47_08890 [Rivihabitans pingtungensis]
MPALSVWRTASHSSARYSSRTLLGAFGVAAIQNRFSLARLVTSRRIARQVGQAQLALAGQ